MNWKAKAAEHEKWIQAAQEIAPLLEKHEISLQTPFFSFKWHDTKTQFTLFTENCYPKCACRDDGDRMFGIAPFKMKNGKYQLRLGCFLCLKVGPQSLKWDDLTLGKERVIAIFANYFAGYCPF